MPQFLDFSTGKPVLRPSERPGIRIKGPYPGKGGYVAEKKGGELDFRSQILFSDDDRYATERTFWIREPGLFQSRPTGNQAYDKVVFKVDEVGGISILSRDEERKFTAGPPGEAKPVDPEAFGIEWGAEQVKLTDSGEAYTLRSGMSTRAFDKEWEDNRAGCIQAGLRKASKRFKGNYWVFWEQAADEALERVEASKALSADLDIPAPPWDAVPRLSALRGSSTSWGS